DEDKGYNQKPEKYYPLKGKVTDKEGVPVPYATITESGTKNAATADANGYFSIQSPDSITLAEASATGFDSKKFILQKKPDSTMELKMDETEESAVVISRNINKSTPLNKTDISKKLEGKVSGIGRSETANQPFPKNEKFEQYLKEIMAPIFDSNNKRIMGEVVLSFAISNDGRPGNIKVMKSSCTPCEKLAIRLLENGPGWQYENDKPGIVVIKF
ncbi:MAG: carboxypeptidase-like regulatory domain-containing protein, partial [Ginsengibacter sp.]